MKTELITYRDFSIWISTDLLRLPTPTGVFSTKYFIGWYSFNEPGLIYGELVKDIQGIPRVFVDEHTAFDTAKQRAERVVDDSYPV